jgi:hypothetical protein
MWPSVELLLAACLMMPSLIILHELGHLLVAKILGLEANVMSWVSDRNCGVAAFSG